MRQKGQEEHFFDRDLRCDVPPDQEVAVALEKDAVRDTGDVPPDEERDGQDDDEDSSARVIE